MKSAKYPIQLSADAASYIVKMFQDDMNKIVKIESIDQFPKIDMLPSSYREKLDSITVSVSANITEQYKTYSAVFHRIDGDEIDQDAFYFYKDTYSEVTTTSGWMQYHGNWDGRTEDAKEARKILDAIKKPTDLDENFRGILNAHKHGNSIIQNARDGKHRKR